MLRLAKYAMGSHSDAVHRDSYNDVSDDDEHKPLLEHVKQFMNPSLLKRFDEETHEIPANLFKHSTSTGPHNWMKEFELMGLPSFSGQYMRLVHVPLDVMHECLRLQVELGRDLPDPSTHSVRQVGGALTDTLNDGSYCFVDVMSVEVHAHRCAACVCGGWK